MRPVSVVIVAGFFGRPPSPKDESCLQISGIAGTQLFDPDRIMIESTRFGRIICVWGTWSLLRDSMAMSLDAVPPGIDPAAVRGFLESRKGVVQVHDLHIWPTSTTEVALTCHMVVPGDTPGDAFLLEVCRSLKMEFGIVHATLQIESDPGLECALAPDHVV